MRRGLALAMVCALAPSLAHAQGDDWFGADKALHASVSAGLGAGGYALASLVWRPRPVRLAAGFGLALSAGVAKELVDLTGVGDPSWRDLAWDAIGASLGALLALGLDAVIDTQHGAVRVAIAPGGLSLRW